MGLLNLLLLTVVAVVAAVVVTDASVSGDDSRSRSILRETFMPVSGRVPKKTHQAPPLKGFQFKNCGDPRKDLANVSSLVLGPDPLVLPGDLKVSFDVAINSTLDAPLKGKVILSRRVGSTWIKIPCIGKIGSCDYSDVCDLLKDAVCPQPFDDHKIPCRCPFPQGKYHLPTATFQVDVPVFPSGDYHAVANVTYKATPVACVELYVTFG